ncbi:UvrD-helicase domain-containing protein [Carboxylicivirga caseinilyticus]|uniref:UvrD-helicase domain-containing protein n=1 Tax=Carboxylicivirga caseinilyticus TaxID=3417572 RepID=UPI003D327073|nr:UvrD-helicase domain-containing protein [Marinilabiliaceae bacterium A049]
MSQLKIYRASAGSGKTYTLSGEFIKLLFEDPLNYKSILAVTFTNKATSEMKNRILENLYALSVENDADYLEDLMKIYNKSKKQIQKTARHLLINILNDFSKFSVNTIDSFFQKVIRSFAYEANLPAGFKVELDTDRVLSQAVDELLRELELKGNEELRGWLINHTLSKIEDGRDWNIASELKTLGKEVFKEEFQSLNSETLEKLQNKQLLNLYNKQLRQITHDFENAVKNLASEGLLVIKQHGVNYDMLHLKSRSPLKNLEKLSLLQKADDILTIQKLIPLVDNPEECFNKKNNESDNNKIADCFGDGLNKILFDLSELFIKNKTNYCTARLISSNINALGITTDIAIKVQEIARNENLFLLADANRLLFQIIDQNETPFIYEKTGTRYQNYMIDEFQDTSRLQWNNFKPLLLNSVAEDKMAMIVGDVKQSIYRWRNSDWKLLSDQVENDFSDFGTDPLILETNWRSFENIIHFNNIVFKEAARMLQYEFISSTEENNPQFEIPEDLKTKITKAYDDTVQKVASKSTGTGGYIKMAFPEGSKKAEFMINATTKAVEEIESLLAKGYEYKDICILVRRKKEGQQITEALLSGIYSTTNQKHPVISNETLLLGSSPAVNLVIQQIKYIQDPENTVYEAYVDLYNSFYKVDNVDQVGSCDGTDLISSDQTIKEVLKQKLLELKGQPLFEMAETLVRELPQQIFEHQFIFIQGLLDAIRDYVTNYSVNVHDFIAWWDDKGMNTAISVPEGQNAINVMTIHKSKGLEFKAVVIPYCNWPIDDKGFGSLIWCKPQSEPFNQIDLVPVSYNSQLLQSHFIGEYLDERLHQFVDNLNLLYVAFTRAKESLIVLGEQPTKTGGLKSVSNILHRIVNQLNLVQIDDASRKEKMIAAWDIDHLIFEYGAIPANENNKINEPQTENYIVRTYALSDRIKIHPESMILNSPDGLINLKKGKLMHKLFELIVTSEDVERAVMQLIINGQIKTSEKDKIIDFISEKINQPLVSEWFNPQNTIINEGDILTPSGLYRPDRVIITKNETIVIDYKFGEIRNDKYRSQVNRYKNLLIRMGYKNVRGFLWYMGSENLIEEVLDQPQQGKLF